MESDQRRINYRNPTHSLCAVQPTAHGRRKKKEANATTQPCCLMSVSAGCLSHTAEATLAPALALPALFQVRRKL